MKNNKIKQKILLLKVRNLDERAFTAIYDLYVTKIYRYIYFKVPSEIEAEDLTSNVFLKMWSYVNSENAKQIDNLNAFIYKIARNSIADFYRKRDDAIRPDENFLQQIKDENNNLAVQVEIDSQVEQIKNVLPKLKEDYREVITLKYIEELNTSEIASILDKSNGAVRILLHRAIKTLKETLNDKDNS